MTRPEQIQAFARGLVAALFPALESAMLAGLFHRAVLAQAAAAAGPGWYRAHGADVALAALAVLDGVSAAVIMCPDLREEWLASAPIEAIPVHPPAEAIATPPPAVEIRGWFQGFADFWRLRGS
jgi:hypothetical protein